MKIYLFIIYKFVLDEEERDLTGYFYINYVCFEL